MHLTADDLIDTLRASGLRITAARRSVCEVIARDHSEHLTAGAIVDRLEGVVDQSTVYRTLETLQEAGVLSHTHLGHGASVFHFADDRPHQHIVCEVCGRVASVDQALFDDVGRAVSAATGFDVDVAHFALVGTCSECSADSSG